MPVDRTAPRLLRERVNGIEIACFEWRTELRGERPTIFLAHATGFHGRVWDQMIHHLGERHVLSVELRGHGRSENAPIEHWGAVGRDVAALLSKLGVANATGVGHSMGGHALLDAAAAVPSAFARLVVIDPVVFAPEAYRGDRAELAWAGEPHPTSRRKNAFASPAEMFERFRERPPYVLFRPEALRDYCEYGLVEAADGEGYVLACPPEIEASVYMTGRSNAEIYGSIRALEFPVLVLRSRERGPERDLMDFSTSPTWPGLVHEFKNGAELLLPELTHFMPMEAPERIARAVLDWEAACGP